MSTGFFSAASAGRNSGIGSFFKPRREKFIGGEFDMLENFARVIGACYALFSGNAEVICGNEHLDPTFKLNNGEKAESNKYLFFGGCHKISAEAVTDAVRKTYAARFTSTVAVFRNTAAENNGGNHLYNGSWIIGGDSAAERIFGTVNFYVALASVKDNFLREEREPAYSVRGGNGGVICGKVYLKIKSHIHGIKPAVEGNGFHLKKNVKYFDAFGLYSKRTVYS